jgi:hypothetical protein
MTAPVARNSLHDGMAAARIEGYSWPEINNFVADRRATSAQAGYSDAEVREHLGLANPAGLDDRLQNMMQGNLVSGE